MLLASGHRNLWSPALSLERMEFLRRASQRIAPRRLTKLIDAVLQGPPKERAPSWVTPAAQKEQRQHQIDELLYTLSEGGVELPAAAKSRVSRIVSVREQAQAGPAASTPPPYTVEVLETWETHELADHLHEKEPSHRGQLLGAWREFSTRNPDRGAAAVRELAARNHWPLDVWKQYLYGLHSAIRNQGTAVEAQVGIDWEGISELLLSAPEGLLGQVIREVCEWLREAVKHLSAAKVEQFWKLWDRCLSFAAGQGTVTGGSELDAVSEAINHPAGHLAQSLLDGLWQRRPERGQGLPADVQERLSKLATGEDWGFRMARVILALDLYSLFLIDQEWTSRYLLPRFDWSTPEEGSAVWQGYLWNARIDPDLLQALKPSFFNMFHNIDLLERESRANALGLLAAVAVEMPSGLTEEESARVLLGLSEPDLAAVAMNIESLLQQAEENSARFWAERIEGWFKASWPKSAAQRGPATSAALARLAAATGDAFPQAVGTVLDFLVPVEDNEGIDHELNELNLPEKFPEATVRLLYRIAPVDRTVEPWTWSDLREVLEKAAAT